MSRRSSATSAFAGEDHGLNLLERVGFEAVGRVLRLFDDADEQFEFGMALHLAVLVYGRHQPDSIGIRDEIMRPILLEQKMRDRLGKGVREIGAGRTNGIVDREQGIDCRRRNLLLRPNQPAQRGDVFIGDVLRRNHLACISFNRIGHFRLPCPIGKGIGKWA
jgi:hypothetical protein